ncbi:NADH-ubiquinone oxidoreductase chain 1 [Podila minutissima]|uniref:Kinesin-like protein n=1 Tax=Podila minutissima TaxID=64525 RepID=A0A9P5SBQ4_9FUNG|nr:NADH-ubiquinone oxidoreductase chain 1 [Podila minutissima]
MSMFNRQHQRHHNHNNLVPPSSSPTPSPASCHFGQRKTSVSTPKPVLPPLTFLHNNNDTLAQSVANAGGDASDVGPSKAENVTVTVRVRPFSNVELRVKGGPEQVWALHEGSRITYADEYSMAGRRAAVEYGYDHALTGSDNEVIYNTSVKSLVQSAMEGYNDHEPGITPRAVDDVFKHIRENSDREFLLRVSYIEIYNESIRDLLSPEAIDLRIHEDRRVIESRERTAASSPKPGRKLSLGLSKPATAVRVSQLNLIDLAGSEKASADMERRKEGAFINKSLLTLGTVIAKLTEEKGAHIPYRDSKLTRILQSSLSGNARVSVICTISPSFVNVEESHNTLKFAARVKKVVTKAHTNQVLDDKALLEKYRREIGELKAQLLLTASSSSSGPNDGYPVDKGAHAELSTLLERERLKHEEEINEMNFIRNALKERIDHLTKLILTSQSINAKPSGPTDNHHRLLSKRSTVETSADGTVLEFPKEIESRLARKDTIVRQLQSELELQQEKVNVMKQALQRTAKGEVVDIERTLAKLEMEPRQKDRFLIEKRASIMSMSGLYTYGASTAQDKETGEKAMMGPTTAFSPDSKTSPVLLPHANDEDTTSLLNLESEHLAIDDEFEDEDLMDTPWNRAELASLRQAKRELEIVVIDQEKKLEEMSVVAFSTLEDSEDFKTIVLELEEHKERILGMEEEREVLKATVTELRNMVRKLELDQAQKEEGRQQQQAMLSLASVGARKGSSTSSSPSSPGRSSSPSPSKIQELEQMLSKERRLRMEEQNRSMARIASLEADLTIIKAEISVRGLE